MRVRDEDLVVRQVGQETVVYDGRRHRAHCLGPLAAAVWRECDSGRSTAEIAERVSAARGEPIDETGVEVALRRLARAGLVDGRAPGSREADSRPHGAPSGAGRREAVRRVAALTGLAVLSVVTPSPAQVASCIPTGGGKNPCTSSSQCCSGCCNGTNNKCTGGGPCLPAAPTRR